MILSLKEFKKWFRCRNDALSCAGSGCKSIWHCPDTGVVLCRKGLWYAANDIRWRKVGIVQNDELAQPAVGPFSTKDEALSAFYRAFKKRRASKLRTLSIVVSETKRAKYELELHRAAKAYGEKLDAAEHSDRDDIRLYTAAYRYSCAVRGVKPQAD